MSKGWVSASTKVYTFGYICGVKYGHSMGYTGFAAKIYEDRLIEKAEVNFESRLELQGHRMPDVIYSIICYQK